MYLAHTILQEDSSYVNMLVSSLITGLLRSGRNSMRAKQSLDVTCIILPSRIKSYGECFLFSGGLSSLSMISHKLETVVFVFVIQ